MNTPRNPTTDGALHGAPSKDPDTGLDDDRLHALVDGRLPGDEAQALRRRLAGDPAARERVHAWQAQRERLRGLHADWEAAPVPPPLAQAARDFQTRRMRSAQAWRMAGLAASLALAFGLGWTLHGTVRPADPAAATLAGAFSAAGIDALAVDDIQPVQWGKLLLNLNNPVNALSDLPLRDELQVRDFRIVFAALQSEALRAMARAGIRPAQVAPVPPALLPHVLRLPDALFTRLARRMLRIDPAARSSMWDDLEAGRPTEIDDLCGAVMRLAAAHGLRAPCNERMCALLAGPRQRLTGAQMRQALGL